MKQKNKKISNLCIALLLFTATMAWSITIPINDTSGNMWSDRGTSITLNNGETLDITTTASPTQPTTILINSAENGEYTIKGKPGVVYDNIGILFTNASGISQMTLNLEDFRFKGEGLKEGLTNSNSLVTTLNMKNSSIMRENPTLNDYGVAWFTHSVILNLTGENVISSKNGQDTSAIYIRGNATIPGNLTINGTGSLAATVDANSGGFAYGIYSYNNENRSTGGILTINASKVTARGGDYLKDASDAINAASVNIGTNVQLTAIGGNSDTQFAGEGIRSYKSITIGSGAKLNLASGNSNGGLNYTSGGVNHYYGSQPVMQTYEGDITIGDNVEMTLAGGASPNGQSQGILYSSNNNLASNIGNLLIGNGVKLTAVATGISKYRPGVSILSDGQLTVGDECTITANGIHSDAGAGGYGLVSKKAITVGANSKITATGGDSTSAAAGLGILMYETATFGADSTLTAKGGKSTEGQGGPGVYALKTLTLNEKATLNATGGNSEKAAGGIAVYIPNQYTSLTLANKVNVVTNGGNSIAKSGDVGIYAYSVAIGEDASVTATGGNSSGDGTGANGVTSALLTLADNATLTATGGSSVGKNAGYGINSSIVRAGKKTKLSTSAGHSTNAGGGHGLFSSTEVTLGEQSVVVVRGGNSTEGIGGDGVFSYTKLTLGEQAILTATGGNSSKSRAGHGVNSYTSNTTYAREIIFGKSSDVTARGGNTGTAGTNGGYGIFSQKMSVGLGAIVKSYGGTAPSGGIGVVIMGANNLPLSGDLSAIAGDTDAPGIYFNANNTPGNNYGVTFDDMGAILRFRNGKSPSFPYNVQAKETFTDKIFYVWKNIEGKSFPIDSEDLTVTPSSGSSIYPTVVCLIDENATTFPDFTPPPTPTPDGGGGGGGGGTGGNVEPIPIEPQLKELTQLLSPDVAVTAAHVGEHAITATLSEDHAFARKDAPTILRDGYVHLLPSFEARVNLGKKTINLDKRDSRQMLMLAVKMTLPNVPALANWAELASEDRIPHLEKKEANISYEFSDGTWATIVGQGGHLSWTDAHNIGVISHDHTGITFNYIVVDDNGPMRTSGDIVIIPDGVRDNHIIDPIWLMQKGDGSGGGSGNEEWGNQSSGCNAAGAPSILLALFALSALLFEKKKR